VAIVLHDTPGYIGCKKMDDEQGKLHPIRGAQLIQWLYLKTHSCTEENVFKAWEYYNLVRYHSSHLARIDGNAPSKLCAPDKVCVLLDPSWWYLFRARLSGEVWEYIKNSPFKHVSPKSWLRWYKAKVEIKYLTPTKN
jgi:hypothetical protein